MLDWEQLTKIPGNLFHLEVPIPEKIIRSIAVYVFLLITFRVAGKRQLAQINTMDLVVLLTISNTVQNSIIGPDNSLLGGLIGAAALVGANALLVHLIYVNPSVGKLVEGEPKLLMEKGKLIDSVLAEEEITLGELEESARHQGFGDLKELETITLETSGNITCIAKQPDTVEQRHQEILARLEALTQELASLRKQS